MNSSAVSCRAVFLAFHLHRSILNFYKDCYKNSEKTFPEAAFRLQKIRFNFREGVLSMIVKIP
jgi:hypothetical protein